MIGSHSGYAVPDVGSTCPSRKRTTDVATRGRVVAKVVFQEPLSETDRILFRDWHPLTRDGEVVWEVAFIDSATSEASYVRVASRFEESDPHRVLTMARMLAMDARSCLGRPFHMTVILEEDRVG